MMLGHDDPLSFKLTHDHITLLRNAIVRWEDTEFGAPAIDPKRPYGNSSVELDIAEKLGWELFADHDGDKHLSREQDERAKALHAETYFALQIILRTTSFEPGAYQRSEQWTNDWKAV